MSPTRAVPEPGSPQPSIYQHRKDKCSPQGCYDEWQEFFTESSQPQQLSDTKGANKTSTGTAERSERLHLQNTAMEVVIN